MCTPKDFNFLSDKIFDELHQHVRTSTLKRLWGYIPSTIMPRKATLDLLAQFAGYANWSGFCGEDILPPHCQRHRKPPRSLTTRRKYQGRPLSPSPPSVCWRPSSALSSCCSHSTLPRRRQRDRSPTRRRSSGSDSISTPLSNICAASASLPTNTYGDRWCPVIPTSPSGAPVPPPRVAQRGRLCPSAAHHHRMVGA